MATLQKRTPIVSVITVNYEDDALTQNFLKHLGTDEYAEVIVVDNSAENTLEQKLSSGIVYIHNATNKGYGGAVNVGVAKAKGEWIMILNNDIETSLSNVKRLIDITKDKETKLATPKLILTDGTSQQSVGYFDSFFQHPLNYVFARPRFINTTNILEPLPVDITTGAAMLLHKTVIDQVGSFDAKTFFMYFEDIDWCLRTAKKGLKWLFIPQVSMRHLQSVTTNKNKKQKKSNYHHAVFNYLVKNRGYIIALCNKLLNLY